MMRCSTRFRRENATIPHRTHNQTRYQGLRVQRSCGICLESSGDIEMRQRVAISLLCLASAVVPISALSAETVACPESQVSCSGANASVCDEISNACDSASCECASNQFLTCRSWFNGDSSQFRRNVEETGITSTNNLTSFYFGNTSGGLEREFRFGGHGDYKLNFDINKLGGPQGQFLQIRAEHRLGDSLSESTGAFLPPNLAADLPTAESRDLYITNFLFTQALSESFALYAGKLDTLDGDDNAFAHGRGITQFSNAAFVVNPIGLRTVAYSTLGTGFVFLHEGESIFNFLVLNARDTVETDGLSELFADGVVLAPELRLPTNFFGMKGHQFFGAIWSSRDYASLAQSPLSLFPSVPIARRSGSWAATYNFDQYLFVDPCDEEKGWGIFGRAGIADPETNPIHYFLSLGVGGNSRLSGRSNDTFGIGWYYSGTSKEIAPFLAATLGGLRDGHGTEIYYNAAVSKRFFITADTQFLSPARSNVDTAIVAGLRANLSF